MAVENDIQAEREADLQPEKGGSIAKPQLTPQESYDLASAQRESKIELPDTTGQTSMGRQLRAGATMPQAGESFFDAQSRGREERIANRPDFNAPYRVTNARGDKESMQTVVGEQGQVATARPPKDVRDIMLQGGARTKKEERRMSRFKRSTAGKAFDFGQFNQKLMKMRRNTLGQKETEKQFDAGFSEGKRPEWMTPNPDLEASGLTQEFRDSNGNGIEDRSEGIWNPNLNTDGMPDLGVDSGEVGDILDSDPQDPVIDSILS